MQRSRGVLVVGVVVLAVLVGACQDREAQQREAEAVQRQRLQALADEQLGVYEQLRAAGNYELARKVGRDLVQNYPDTAAATAAQATLEETRLLAERSAEAARLAGMWTYHAVEEDGGVVRTAQIRPVDASASDPAYAGPGPAPGVSLVLRDHHDWGQSVYILSQRRLPGCEDSCTVPVAFGGGEAEPWKATVSEPQHPPAVFIEDDQAFIERLAEAETVRVELALGERPQLLEFEVGGFDPARYRGTAAAGAGEDTDRPER